LAAWFWPRPRPGAGFLPAGLLRAALLLAAGLPAGAGAAEPASYFIRSWRTENGLPDNAVTSIVQTRDGYLWLATYGGLARFDGVSFTVFNTANTPALQSDRTTSLFEDAQGNLWIGHERGDLTRLHQGEFEAREIHETGNRRKISAIGSDHEGDIWMLNEEGTLVRARDGASCALPNQDGVVQMAQNARGKLWVASAGRLAAMEQGRLAALTDTNGPGFVGSYIQGIGASHDGGLWIVSDGRVRKRNGGVWVEDRGTNPCGSTISTMMETASGCLALGTVDSGLYLMFPNGGVKHFSQAEGLPHDWIRCLGEDREGTLWVGAGSGGLVALRPGKVEPLSPPDHWQGRVTLSATVSRDGALWVGTEGAGLYRLLNGEWKNFDRSTGLSNMYVWCVAEDAQGRMWAGTWGGGVFRQQGGRFVAPPGLENLNIPAPAILQTPDGVTWLGTAIGLVRYENGAVREYGEKEGLKVPDVRAIVADRDGTLWFGMLGGGLGRLQNGGLKQFRKSDGLASDYVQCLHRDADGALWIGTYGGGLNRFQNGSFTKVTSAAGLPNDFICDIEEDGRGYFWISSHGGIFRVSKKELTDCLNGRTAAVHGLSYSEGDGMASLECSGGLQPAACQLPDGRIGFPTGKGVALVDPRNAMANHLAPPVVIETIIAGGRKFSCEPDAKPPLAIPAGLQRFEFHYTGLSFIAPEKMQFQYRLAGWDKDWLTAANNKRVAEYSYLPPGDYQFQVRAANSDGVWNETGASLALRVLPLFWQTWWFHAAAAAVAIALVAGTVSFISRRRLRHKLERIEHQQELERERTRIAKDIHDHLGANLTRISLLSQSAHGELGNPAHAAAQLDCIYDTSRELTRSMDEIVWAVNPQHDTLDSLASYLGNFAQEYFVSLNIRCRLDVPLHLPHWPITAETRHNVFLAFKESLHNIVKHSGANEVTVSLVTDDVGFQVAVRDNGGGFEPAQIVPRPGRGNGLNNMRHRLETAGGRCEIHSAPGTGAEIKFFVSVPGRARKIRVRKRVHK
jgi:ligand-binding sensor domain-containing protein/signal transduction histidine kinase